jgi:hypothetical protein
MSNLTPRVLIDKEISFMDNTSWPKVRLTVAQALVTYISRQYWWLTDAAAALSRPRW